MQLNLFMEEIKVKNNIDNYDKPEDTKEKSIKKRIGKKKIINEKRTNTLIISLILGVLLILGVITLFFSLANKSPSQEILNRNEVIDTNTDKDEKFYIDHGPLEMQTEYKMKNKVGDLKSIYINQRYYETIKIEGISSQNLVDRKTNYHIYIMKEIKSNKKESFFF